MRLQCKMCNQTFSEEEMYSKTKEWYNNFNSEVKHIMIDKEGNLKIPHLYRCPKCGAYLNNVSLRKDDD